MSTIQFSSPPLLFHTCYSCERDSLCFLSLSPSTIHGFRLSFIRAAASPESIPLRTIFPCSYAYPLLVSFQGSFLLFFFNSVSLFPTEKLACPSPEMNPMPLILRWKTDYIFYFYSSLRLLIIIAADDVAFPDPLFLISLLCATPGEKKSESNCLLLLLMFLL